MWRCESPFFANMAHSHLGEGVYEPTLTCNEGVRRSFNDSLVFRVMYSGFYVRLLSTIALSITAHQP